MCSKVFEVAEIIRIDSGADVADAVSVMVPAFNASCTIVDTLNSVRAQTYRPIELIIIDDGSEDSTFETIQIWLNSNCVDDLFVRVYRQKNKGLLACRRIGLELSTGRYLQFLDADDIIHPEKLAICMKIFQSNSLDVVVSRTEKFKEIQGIKAKLDSPPAIWCWNKKEVEGATITNTFWHSVGPLFSREIVEKAGRFPSYVNPVAEELEFHARVKLTTKRVCYIDKTLNFYRVGNSASVTGSLPRLYEGRVQSMLLARNILIEFNVHDRREWDSLAYMAIQTYWQVLNLSEDRDLSRRAWIALQSIIGLCGGYRYKVLRLMPEVFVIRLFRVAFIVRILLRKFMSC